MQCFPFGEGHLKRSPANTRGIEIEEEKIDTPKEICTGENKIVFLFRNMDVDEPLCHHSKVVATRTRITDTVHYGLFFLKRGYERD